MKFSVFSCSLLLALAVISSTITGCDSIGKGDKVEVSQATALTLADYARALNVKVWRFDFKIPPPPPDHVVRFWLETQDADKKPQRILLPGGTIQTSVVSGNLVVSLEELTSPTLSPNHINGIVSNDVHLWKISTSMQYISKEGNETTMPGRPLIIENPLPAGRSTWFQYDLVTSLNEDFPLVEWRGPYIEGRDLSSQPERIVTLKMRISNFDKDNPNPTPW